MNTADHRDWRTLFRARFYELRELGEITQESLADRVGVSQGTVSSWLTGSKEPRLKRLTKIEQALGLPPNTLVASKTAEHQQPFVAALLDVPAIEAALIGLEQARAAGTLPADTATQARIFARAYSLQVLSKG
jgi:transcriptional regulator with XRE-family HTH domain